MKFGNDNISESAGATNAWYRCAVATALVSGIFSVIVCVFMLLNHGKSTIVDTEQEMRLLELRADSRTQPENEQLLSQIRELDLQIRRQRFRSLNRSRMGGFLLLGGVVIVLISLKVMGELKRELPAPRGGADKADEQIRKALLARWVVTAGMVLLGLASVFLALRPKIDFPAAGAAGTSSMSAEDASKSWPSFRGPDGSGISTHANVPADWDGETGKGILWKTKVPLPGHNSPVVWGDRVFLSGADPNSLQVYCFDAASGALLWTGDVTRVVLKEDEEPIEPMEDTGFCASTVATDGRHVCAIFATGDLGCFDFKGRKVWEKSLGIPDSAYGYASSLAVYRNLFVIQYDQGGIEDGLSALMALDGFSGEIVWQTKRPVGNSWSSPIVAPVGEQIQIITCADPWVIAYEPANGTELWRAECLAGDIAPSPIYSNGFVFAIEPYSKMVAIRADGRGDVTQTHIAWSMEEGAPDICSPLSNGELIFLLATEGLLSCHKLSDGTKVWEHDFEEYFQASPGMVDDKVYLLSEKGEMFIVEAGPEYKQLAKCELGEECRASPAFADGHLFIRGLQNLYCIGNSN
ncbi:MAG: outer membrane protein assembly factor BamB family protein [Planctomycetota bacterium]